MACMSRRSDILPALPKPEAEYGWRQHSDGNRDRHGTIPPDHRFEVRFVAATVDCCSRCSARWAIQQPAAALMRLGSAIASGLIALCLRLKQSPGPIEQHLFAHSLGRCSQTCGRLPDQRPSRTADRITEMDVFIVAQTLITLLTMPAPGAVAGSPRDSF